MDTNKHIAKALLNKSFAEAKELVFKSLYAKASLALDEARFAVANGVFNAVEEEAKLDEMAQTRERSDEMDMKQKVAADKWYNSVMGKKGSLKNTKAANKKLAKVADKNYKEKGDNTRLYGKGGKVVGKITPVKEETEQLDEVSPPDMEKMTGSKHTKASFAKQYGKRGKSVMYATAWKLHNKKAGKD